MQPKKVPAGGSQEQETIVENGLLKHVQKCLEIQKQIGVHPPIAVAVTITKSKGLVIGGEQFRMLGLGGNTVQEANLVLPESIVDTFDKRVEKY